MRATWPQPGASSSSRFSAPLAQAAAQAPQKSHPASAKETTGRPSSPSEISPGAQAGTQSPQPSQADRNRTTSRSAHGGRGGDGAGVFRPPRSSRARLTSLMISPSLWPAWMKVPLRTKSPYRGWCFTLLKNELRRDPLSQVKTKVLALRLMIDPRQVARLDLNQANGIGHKKFAVYTVMKNRPKCCGRASGPGEWTDELAI